MAVQKINYENKEAIQNDTDIANKNKVTDADMNEIKTVVNNNANELQELQNKEVNNSTDIEQLKRNTLELQTNVNNIQQEQATQNQKILNNSNNLDLVADQLGETEQGFLQYKRENNQRVTYAEQNIIDLQGRERLNKENIETLQQEVQELQQDIKANEIEEETEQAKSLYINDASGARGKLNVFGNDEQETREGYNLIDILNLELKGQDKGITVKISPDGHLSANGTVKDSSASYTVFITTNVDNLLTDKETYTLWQEIYGKDQNDGIMLQIIANPKTDVEKKYINSATSKKTFVVDKINYSYILTIQLGVVDSSTVFNNYKNRYMLYKGTDDKEFELYGASPSLDYLSAIKSLGSNINLYPGWEIGTINGETGNLANDPKYIRSIDFIPVLPNISYAIKAQDIENINELNTAIRMYNTNKEYLGNKHLGFIQNQRISFILTNTDVRYIKIVSSNNATITDTAKVNIKLEEGETATSYSPMGQGSTKIKKTNRNYLDSFNYYTANTSKTINGITFKINPDGTITANGTATANAFFDFSYTHVIGTNKKMIINNIGGTATGTVRFTAYNKDFSTTTSVLRETTGTQEMNLSDNIEYSVFRYAVYQNAVCNNLTLGFMVLDKTETDRTYTQHQEENYILNIQQEMLEGDYFDLETKEEVHSSGKAVLDGTEGWTKSGTASTDNFAIFYINRGNIVSSGEVKSNALKYVKDYRTQDTYVTSVGEAINIRIATEIIGGNTIELFKTFLQNRYNEGKAIEVYYKRSTPARIPLTADQIEVLEKLNKLRFHEGTNNILTTEDIALLQAIYPVSIQTKINNVISTQLKQIGGN